MQKISNTSTVQTVLKHTKYWQRDQKEHNLGNCEQIVIQTKCAVRQEKSARTADPDQLFIVSGDKYVTGCLI